MDEECLCICCNLDGFEGCPKSDAQENEMALKKENKKLKEQQLTVDTIEKVFDKHTIIANSDILYRKDLAIDIIKAREVKTEEASK